MKLTQNRNEQYISSIPIEDRDSREEETLINSSELEISREIIHKSLHLIVSTPPPTPGGLSFFSTRSIFLCISCRQQNE